MSPKIVLSLFIAFFIGIAISPVHAGHARDIILSNGFESGSQPTCPCWSTADLLAITHLVACSVQYDVFTEGDSLASVSTADPIKFSIVLGAPSDPLSATQCRVVPLGPTDPGGYSWPLGEHTLEEGVYTIPEFAECFTDLSILCGS